MEAISLPVVDALGAARLPMPRGWYFVGASSSVAPGQVVTKRLFGQDVVLFRTESGRFAATQPYCPHLGAHLGHAGSVKGESIRCAFHGFCFDAAGACVETPYEGKPPPKAKLRTFPSDERHGLLYVWFDPAGEAPSFDLPMYDMTGWPPFLMETYALRSHPQEISENAVDAGHFTVLHGYRSVRMREPVSFDGPFVRAKYALGRDAGIFGKPGAIIETQFDVTLHGLGVNHIESYAENFGLGVRIMVFQTPTEEGRIDLTLGITVRLHEPRKLHFVVGLMPKKFAHWLVQRAALFGFKQDVSQDRVMWDTKAYLPGAAIAGGDGPIGKYRQWARQFYGPGRVVEAVPSVSAEPLAG